MSDYAHLPETFDGLRESVPEGVTLSERVIDPVIILGKDGTRTVARLAGVRRLRGNKIICFAPDNRHSWVVDDAILRPLPKDAAHLFAMLLGDTDPHNVPYSVAIGLMRNKNAIMEVEPDDDFLRAGRENAEYFDAQFNIPGLAASLLTYQARGVQWMLETINHTGGLILADEMGLGKTLQIIALLLIDPPPLSAPALIVCPTSLIANWVREITRFAKCLTVLIHRGADRVGIYSGLQKTNVVITTYDTMVNDISLLSSFEWSWLICDEAQAIKNPDSNRRQAIVKIPRRRAIAMTGTPVENGLLDLWSLADFAIPGLLGTRREFEKTYPDSMESAKAIGIFTDPILLKRRVIDVAGDLPERIDIDIPLELDEQLVAHYIEVRKTTLARYPVAGALVATLQLQLVCAHPWLRLVDEADDEGGDAVIQRSSVYPLMTPKMDRVAMLVKEAFFNGKKVIVFALFNRIGDLLKEALEDFPNAYWNSINGSTPSEKRQPVIDDFSAHQGPGCLVLNPKAAGAGLNITAATVVIHFTPMWNPALEAQASARAHRRGQTQTVTVYRLFYKDTVEEIMIERSLWKSELANESASVSSRNAGDLERALSILPGKL